MLLFSNAKINLGLRVTAKRQDGYHDIETIMLPVGLSDILEFIESTEDKTSLTQTGIQLSPAGALPSARGGEREKHWGNSRIDDSSSLAAEGVNGSLEDNLVIRALELLRKDFYIPPLKIHLHKFIPPGAGLGGGSSNAGFMLRGLNVHFKLGIDEENLIKYAAILGSDCAFFIRNKPCLIKGKGEIMEDLNLSLGFYMVLLFPGFSVSTKEAYNGIIPRSNITALKGIISDSTEKWTDNLINQFEEKIFPEYPVLAEIKTSLYKQGAFYASMTGSGSAMYGLFRGKPDLDKKLEDIKIWEGEIF